MVFGVMDFMDWLRLLIHTLSAAIMAMKPS